MEHTLTVPMHGIRALIPQEQDTGSCGEAISSRPLWHDACIGMHLCTGDIVAGRTPSKLSRSVHTTRCKIRLRHHAHTRGNLPNGRISGTNGRISGTNGSFSGSSTNLPTWWEPSMSSCARAAYASGRCSAIAGRIRPLPSNCSSRSSSTLVPGYILRILGRRK